MRSSRSRKKRRVYLTKITQEKESYERALQELERSASRIDSLLRELEQRRRAAAAKPPSGLLCREGVKGGLPWPAEGSVLTYFGRQKHPTFNTYVQRKGIEIRTIGRKCHPCGHARDRRLCGLVERLRTRYNPRSCQRLLFALCPCLEDPHVGRGGQVAAGQAIGETGDTGMTGENTLYFELREGAEPVDPLQWLARR